ncbi:MAG: PKD domain-containing protein, partial [Caldilineae bacterium]
IDIFYQNVNNDQRGVTRPQDGDGNGSALCDVGAYEAEYILPLTVNTGLDEYNGNDATCSLREAIQSVNQNTAIGGCNLGSSGYHTITVPAGSYDLTVADADPATNIAQGKTATQSSTFSALGVASHAVDGNTNGYWNSDPAVNSVTHTNPEPNAWWEVDLGAVYEIGQIKLWNRTDCCWDRLSNFYVFVSDAPFPSTDPVATSLQAGVWWTYHAGSAGRTSSQPLTLQAAQFIPSAGTTGGLQGRYVRVQLTGTEPLSLAEVQVYPADRTNAAGDLDILSTMSIVGDGADTTVIDAHGIDRVMRVKTSGAVRIEGVTLRGGAVDGVGGGLHAWAEVTLDGVVIDGNRASGEGGGIYGVQGLLTIFNSTISNNESSRAGGGLFYKWGTLTILNSTVVGNTARWGGGIGLLDANSANLTFTTIANNGATAAGANINNSRSTVNLFATIIANPGTGAATDNCAGDPLTSQGGYNRISDASCSLQNPNNDNENATIDLEPLAHNGGPTPTMKPAGRNNTVLVDIVPPSTCTAKFQPFGISPRDQRGKKRPAWGIRREGEIVLRPDWKCDAGAVELGATKLLVCGAPLLPLAQHTDRCTYESIAGALADAQTGDVIVVSGVITETATVAKSVTIRGPTLEEGTPAVHMGIIQAAPTANTSAGSVLTIIDGVSVLLQDLNIRHGDASQGGGINNAGDLILQGVTLYHNAAQSGGAIYNSGALTVTNSTVFSNTAGSGGGIYNASGGTVQIAQATLADNTGGTIDNAGDVGAVRVGSSILSVAGGGALCQGNGVASDDYNLLQGTCADLSQSNDTSGDPQLGPLRDNGGPTLTLDLGPDSAAIEAGPPAEACTVQTDQRGKPRPFDMSGGGSPRCDSGAIEYGLRTLTVCPSCEDDPASGRFYDLQKALTYAMAGDVVAVEAGTYTGNFIAYKDVTLRHAGIDVSRLSPEQAVDVRAILQASPRSISEQQQQLDPQRMTGLAGTVLTVEAFWPSGTTISAGSDLTVTLRGLTLQHGLSRQGGAIYNLGNLQIFTSTLAGNAAVNGLDNNNAPVPGEEARGGAIYNAGRLSLVRSTISGNLSEYYGGAIYNAGTAAHPASLLVEASTLADNRAARLPDQHVVAIESGPVFVPAALTIVSGDIVQFENHTGQEYTLFVNAEATCNRSEVVASGVGTGLSEPLICSSGPVILTAKDNSDFSIVITVDPLGYMPQGHNLFLGDDASTSIGSTILVRSAGMPEGNCAQSVNGVAPVSQGYNLVDDSTCNLSTTSDLRFDNPLDARLGPLQDNNHIDFQHNTVSGYTYTHALLPGSPAIDRIPPQTCGVADAYQIDVSSPQTIAILTGDIASFSNNVASTVALNDGEATVQLIDVPGPGGSRARQFDQEGTFSYRVYDNATRQEIGHGSIAVQSRTRMRDQRGVLLPQRSSAANTFNCDIGAYEFQPWIVGQPVYRPASAVATQPATWNVGHNIASGYHVHNGAQMLDIALRPSPNNNDDILAPDEIVTVSWDADPDPQVQENISQQGVILWPDAPQIHVSGAGVALTHQQISDGYQISSSAAHAFEGLEPADEDTGPLVVDGVFRRTTLPAKPGDSYSVLQWAGSNGDIKIQVVKTVDWNTPGVRDMRSERTQCEIGRELRYLPFTDDVGTLPGHEDPEGKSGQVLYGDAFDGVRKTTDLAFVQNTVGNLIPPAYNQETREGPIIPILNSAPTDFGGSDEVGGGHDLRIAWYRPDARNVAWPVKTVGYRCDWPADAPEIVIASELGSEIGGQPELSSDAFSDLSIYHQSDKTQPGFSPNWEHALLAASNLGNPSPALYALRTDLHDRNPIAPGNQSYALLKYHDPREDGRTKIAIYKVMLTRPAEPVTNYSTQAGTVTLNAAAVQAQAVAAPPNVVLRVNDGSVTPGGEVTLPLEALGARNLHAISLDVTYDDSKLSPTHCSTNRNDFVEELYGLQMTSDSPQWANHVMHFSAALAAGTDAQFTWDFGDGTVRVAGPDVSHVYGSEGRRTVTVTATNGVFSPLSTWTEVTIANAAPGTLAELPTNGCRIESPGRLHIELQARSKHGLSGDLLLSELTFAPTAAFSTPGETTQVGIANVALFGPDYEQLRYDITAGNPVYAPTPLRGLLDIQPCTQTRAADITARPFWKDWKGQLWARAAGDMDVLYFYPLQPGFYLTDAHARSLGLIDDQGNTLSEADRVGHCVPWMDRLAGSQTTTIPYALPHTIATDATGTKWVHAADVNGDNQQDLIYASDTEIAWYENPGGGSGLWTRHPIFSGGGFNAIYPGDLDGDNAPDVIYASNTEIGWYKNQSGGSSWSKNTILTNGGPFNAIYPADLNDDNHLDIVYASNSAIEWLENLGTGLNFGNPQQIYAVGADSIIARDVNKDNIIDIISSNNNSIVLIKGKTDCPLFAAYCHETVVTLDNVGSIKSIHVADLDKKNNLDVVFASDTEVGWYESTNSDGTAWMRRTIFTSSVPIYPADVNGDGYADIVAAFYSDNEVKWYKNDGSPADGGWKSYILSTEVDGPRAVYAADINGDDLIDAISASENDNRLAWYQNATTTVLNVGYHAVWPPLPPLLSVGETVYERAKSGISGVANQLAVSRIYDDLAPGEWDEASQRIVTPGSQVQRTVAQIIDPVGEVRVHLNLKINDNWSLPGVIKTQRLLFGGGQAIVGNKNDPNLALPFALRSRVLYDDGAGDLIFRGYYDGTSKEYIKGDPLLLLNVMSTADKQRLLDLCPEGGENCGPYRDAVEALYWRTWNPRGLDLCRDSQGYLSSDDIEPDTNQGPAVGADSSVCPNNTYRDGQPDHAFLIGVQDANNDGIPEPYEGLGKGKALTAGNAAGTGYITLAYNNDPSLGGLPVSLQVIKVGCTKNHLGEDSTYRGNLLVIKSDNLFDEKLTLRHTGDFGGRPDKFQFQWFIAPVDDTGVSPTALPPEYPWTEWLDPDGPEITIEGANPTTLRDNWLIMRYKGYPVCGNAYQWSAFAGDPSAKPSEVRAQFAPGWIKRVTSALNPFDARVADFVSAPTNTTVDMIRQAGHRYEGPVALSNDPETLNNMGLIEAYETVLDRGRKLSIDSGVNDQGANAALLNVTSRIADLYMLLGNDAYMDALDPTVGLTTGGEAGMRAPAIYAFMNQFRPDAFGPIDEELALLRGRDETLGGVAAAPTYNRLTWNFTNGEGEVAYVTNYNIKDMNQDGFVDEADAAIMYPQGHGDAWGHMLTAIGKYYQLLRHPNYTWSPRAEPIGVAGAPVVVDYYDEQRFATAAANKAQIGAEIVDLTYRKQYAEPESQEYVDSHIDASDGQRRAWGVADWARRAGQGAYFDWVVANAILPPQETRYSDVRKIDRSTVTALGEIVDQYAAIQQQLDEADQGLNPLGLATDAVLFDLDPAQTKTTPEHDGKTHFEQVYDRALVSLANTTKLFDYANQMKLAQRQSQDNRRDFVTSIIEEDTALINELIELFGYPYDADIGVNGTYPEGYDGPDIYNYDLWDRNELTDAQKRCASTNEEHCSPETTTYTIAYQPLECLGNYLKSLKYTDPTQVTPDLVCPEVTSTVAVTYTIGVGLDAGRGRFKPASWPEDSARKAPGEIQNALQDLTEARLEYEMAITAYQNQVQRILSMQNKIQARAAYLDKIKALKNGERWTLFGLDQLIRAMRITARSFDEFGKTAKNISDESTQCLPRQVGTSNDPSFVPRCVIALSGETMRESLKKIAFGMNIATEVLGVAKESTQAGIETRLLAIQSDYELKQFAQQMSELLREEKELRLALYMAKDQWNSAQGNYDQILQRGFRTLQKLSRLRKRWAGQITEQRYNDMAYRIFQNDALRKYRKQFDMAQMYTYLTAAAYDYDTNLSRNDPASGDKFLRQIVELRSLGEIRWSSGPWDIEPIAGSGGLAEPLAQMRDNFAVLKGQMGFNNPQAEANRFSLRRELFRLGDASDAKWRQELMRYYTPDIFSNDAVARLAKRPYGETGPQPGLVIPIATTITEGKNFFGWPLGPGDSAYDASQFSTKIANVGVWFKDYDTNRLAQTPRVYLLPAGKDVGRPRNSSNLIRYWNVTEQLLPVPYPITQADMENPDWIPSIHGLDGQIYQIKPYARFRAYPYSPTLSPNELNTDTRLIGRSVWNTQWLLVIPGATLLSDPQIGIERFIEDVTDIYIYFQTYAYAGTAVAQQADAAQTQDVAGLMVQSVQAATSSSALPLPDFTLYGTVRRDGQPLQGGTVKVLLPRGGELTADIAPIAGTDLSYVLSIPLRQYDPSVTDYDADSVRPGESISFQINGSPAMFAGSNGIVANAFTIPLDGIGRTQRLDLFLSGPDAYPLGDVNASGRRDSADALLVLKYDVGLIPGVTTFPPGPRTVYLPLCDIVQDGLCNASDALRILQCDVGMPGVDCPDRPTAASQQRGSAPEGTQLNLHLQIEPEAAGDQVTVRVWAGAEPSFGAATLELVYDMAALTPAACAEAAPAGTEMSACNIDYAPGVARVNAVRLAGLGDDTPLATLTFRRNGVLNDAALLSAFSLAVVDAVDTRGATLAWQLAAPEIIPIPGDGSYPLYLPLLWRFQASAPPQTAPGDIPAPPAPSSRLYLPVLFPDRPLASTESVPASDSDYERTLYLPVQRH